MQYVCDWNPVEVDKIILREKKILNYCIMKRIEAELQNLPRGMYSSQTIKPETL